MFPWVCLATMPLFYPFDWPKIITSYAEKHISNVKGATRNGARKVTLNNKNSDCSTDVFQKKEALKEKSDELSTINKFLEETDKNTVPRGNNEMRSNRITYPPHSVHVQNRKDGGNNVTCLLITLHVLTQGFLPFSHFITKGYNNWTNGLYGYSWDMMVHTWDLESVVVKVVDNTNREEFYVDPDIYTPNDRWTRHGDMVYQYARCLKGHLVEQLGKNNQYFNISIYVDVWCSMNGRFTQRMFDSKVDLLNATWSPFKTVSYLMPLLDEALGWRSVLHDTRTEVHSWSNNSDVIFIADFPGYAQEKYIPPELTNISVTVLNGNVAYEPEVSKLLNAQSYRLKKGNHIKIAPGTFHKILNIGEIPAFYMYTFANSSEELEISPPKSKLPIGQELLRRLNNMLQFASIVGSNIIQVFLQFKFCT